MFCIVFKDVAKGLACCWFREYYKFDCIFYRDRNTKHFPESSAYVTNVAVALEHENVPEASDFGRPNGTAAWCAASRGLADSRLP